MNKTAVQPHPLRGKSIKLGRDDSRSILVETHGAAFFSSGGEYISMTKEEAINAATTILLAYEVPFCNRVKDSGLE